MVSRRCLVTFAPAAGLLSSGVLGCFTRSGQVCGRHVTGVRVLHMLSRAEHREITEWSLCSVGSQSRHQKHGPMCQLPLNNSAWVFLGPRQTLWFFLLSSPCLVSFIFGGGLKCCPAPSEPSWVPCFSQGGGPPNPLPSQPWSHPSCSLLTLLCPRFLSSSLCICSCYSGALCALCFHQRPDENQSPTSCPGLVCSEMPHSAWHQLLREPWPSVTVQCLCQLLTHAFIPCLLNKWLTAGGSHWQGPRGRQRDREEGRGTKRKGLSRRSSKALVRRALESLLPGSRAAWSEAPWTLKFFA